MKVKKKLPPGEVGGAISTRNNRKPSLMFPGLFLFVSDQIYDVSNKDTVKMMELVIFLFILRFLNLYYSINDSMLPG